MKDLPKNLSAAEQRAWERLGDLSRLKPGQNDPPDRDFLAPARLPRRRAVILPLFLAVAATAALIFWSPSFLHRPGPPTSEYALSAGHSILSDGSAVDLEGGATAKVRFTAAERGVELIRGRARFAVVKNAARPFVVHAGGVAVRDVGTVFVVNLKADAVELLVTEGRVQVTPPAARAAGPRPESYILAAGDGEKTIYLRPAAPSPLLALPATARNPGRSPGNSILDLKERPLSEIVAEFNQRNRVRLLLAEPGLGAMKIGGRIRYDNIEGFVRMLRSFGVEAQADGNTIILRRQR